MSRFFSGLHKYFTPIEPISPGIYHYQAPQDDPRNYRLHLRIEDDGRGLLIVNASTVLHLNETATEYTYYFVKNLGIDEVVRKMVSRYRIDAAQVKKDYLDLADRILTLVELPDLDPVTFLDFTRQMPYSGKVSAPYRLDCALTYCLPPTADPSAAPKKRVDRELTSMEWKNVLDKVWQAGIPHVIFTGGEPTLRDDLPELIAHAEHNGQVSGLLTDGHRLTEPGYLNSLLQTGLDHLMILLDPDNERSWNAIQCTLPEDIYVAVHYTISSTNKEEGKYVIDRLTQLGVKAVSLSISDTELKSTLEGIRDYAASKNLSLVWDIPVPYSAYNPVNLELVNSELLEGAGRVWLYVEPDGDILPTQGSSQILGNILNDPWEQFWKP